MSERNKFVLYQLVNDLDKLLHVNFLNELLFPNELDKTNKYIDHDRLTNFNLSGQISYIYINYIIGTFHPYT